MSTRWRPPYLDLCDHRDGLPSRLVVLQIAQGIDLLRRSRTLISIVLAIPSDDTSRATWKEWLLAMTGPDALGNYSTTIALDPGQHEYKFLIDGETFRRDPCNPEFAGFFHNSLIRLP